jgi:RNA polymerase sigma-70 factor (ECF subfamily)
MQAAMVSNMNTSAAPPPAPQWVLAGENDGVAPQTLPVADLERLYTAHHDKVFRAAFRVIGNASDAEDVVQTVFLRLLRNDHTFQTVEDAGNYLYRAGVNAALDLVRSRKTSATAPLEEHSPPDPGWKPDREHHAAELREKLREAVATLHETAAEMFVLRYFEGYDNAEVARICNTTEGTVAVTLHRTRARLQKELGAIR